MATPVYCAVADVVGKLPAGGVPNPARVAFGNAAGDYLVSEGHGLVDGAAVTLRAETDGSLPGGLTEGTTYYARVVSAARFQLAASPGGAAIALSTDGENFVFRVEPRWDAWIAGGSRYVDAILPEHVTPLVADLARWPDSYGYSPIIVDASAVQAALLALEATGGQTTVDALVTRRDAAMKAVRDWAKTLPVRGLAAQRHQPANLAVTAAAGAYDPRGWGGSDDTRIP